MPVLEQGGVEPDTCNLRVVNVDVDLAIRVALRPPFASPCLFPRRQTMRLQRGQAISGHELWRHYFAYAHHVSSRCCFNSGTLASSFYSLVAPQPQPRPSLPRSTRSLRKDGKVQSRGSREEGKRREDKAEALGAQAGGDAAGSKSPTDQAGDSASACAGQAGPSIFLKIGSRRDGTRAGLQFASIVFLFLFFTGRTVVP